MTTARALDEGLQKILVPETIDVVFDENNGKLVLVNGPLNVEDDLQVSIYGIRIKAVKLKKVVQMYQWYETADPQPSQATNNHPGDEHDHHVETSYSYATEWFDQHIDSNAFHNPMGLNDSIFHNDLSIAVFLSLLARYFTFLETLTS